MRCALLLSVLLVPSAVFAQDKGREAAAPRTETKQETKDSADASEEVRKEGDSEVKVMEFSGLDIEGQLKTPQMLYFLNRLRAEFGRPRLPHRSFMPELKRSAKGDEF